MNIFATSIDPVQCAQDLDDLRLNKMLIETGQLLSTALHFRVDWRPQGFTPAKVYKPTHQNHPCAVWVRADINHFWWTFRLFNAMQDEYWYRRDKLHATFAKLYDIIQATLIEYELTHNHSFQYPHYWANCSAYKDDPNTQAAYRLTMIDKWNADLRIPTWTKRGAPVWRNAKLFTGEFA